MPARSKISRLPEDMRGRLNGRLIAGGFSDYKSLAQWLADEGYEISRCAVQRYGAKLEERLEAVKIATEQARAIVEVSPDREGAMSDALMRLVQEKYIELLVALDTADVDVLKKIAHPVANMVRASVNQKRLMQQMREKLADQLKTAGQKVAEAASQGGLSPDAEKKIRDALLDIRV